MDPEEDELLLDQQEDEQDLVIDDDDEAGEEEDISFGDRPEEDGETVDLPKKLRDRIKEQDRVIALLTRQTADAQERSRPAPVEVGERPTLESCDYDEDKFKSETDAWIDRSLQAQTVQQQPNTLEDEAKQDVAKYEGSFAKLSYADAPAITAEVKQALTPQQEFVIASVSENPALLLYGLGKNPEKLRELIAIKNPAKFIAAVARMETKMSVGKRTVPNPERIPQGNAAPRSSDKEEARLEKEADRTGDRTALIRYRANKRNQGK